VVDRSVDVATVGQAVPQRVEAILPLDDGLLAASAVLDEEVAAARFEHATHLGKGGLHVRNGAERPRRDDAIETPRIERETIVCGERSALYGKARLLYPLLYFANPLSCEGVDAVDRLHIVPVVPEVSACAEPDLEYVARSLVHSFRSEVIHEPHGEVLKPGLDPIA
jgi:hypothetical protein